MYQNGYQGNQGDNFWQQAPFQPPLENREIIELLKLIQSGEIARAKLGLDQKVADDRRTLGVLAPLQRKEQEEARLELQKAAQNSRVALDILKLVQSGQIAAADQLHRQAADLQRWRTDMARPSLKARSRKPKTRYRIESTGSVCSWRGHNSAIGNGQMVSASLWIK